MLEQQGAVLEEGRLGGNGLFTFVFLLGRRSRRIPPGAGLGAIPLPVPAPRGQRSEARGQRMQALSAPYGAGTVPLLPLDYQKVEQGMAAGGNCCRQQARVPECGAVASSPSSPSHPIPAPGLSVRPSLQNEFSGDWKDTIS